MSTPPQNQPENHQSDADSSDPSLNQPPPPSPEPESAGGEEQEEEEGECGFCLFMKGGGCKDTFIDWENCVKEAEDKNEDLVEKCSQVTAKLKECMDSHSDYYEPILRAEKHAEEQVAIELEKEKQVSEVSEVSEASNDQQEAPSQSNQNDRELELKATPTPPKEDEKEQSNSEAEKRSPDQPASDAPKVEDKEEEEEEEEEEGECGFCVFMKGGGCRDTFVDWENCVKEAEENKEDIVEKCSQVTSLLKQCMDSHSDYYAPILVAEKQIEEQAVFELEKEKLDSELDLKAVPTPPKEDEKEQSNSEAENRSTSPDQPASEAPKAEDKEAEKQIEEQTVIELEKEKLDSTSNNEKEKGYVNLFWVEVFDRIEPW